jgi:hypothetical protein
MEIIDPAKSPYANFFGYDYVRKIAAFYDELGIKSAIWTTPVTQAPPEFFEADKPVEYLLEINEDRVIAYVNELTWSPYLHGMRSHFEYSRTPIQYQMTSVLVATPIRKQEIKEFRRYRRTMTGHCELVEAKPW